MNLRITAYLLGKLAVACAMALCIPLAVAVLYNEENISAFLWAIAWSAGTGVLLVIGGHRVKDTLTVREGIAVTTLGWVLISFLRQAATYPFWTVLWRLFQAFPVRGLRLLMT